MGVELTDRDGQVMSCRATTSNITDNTPQPGWTLRTLHAASLVELILEFPVQVVGSIAGSLV